MDDDGLWRPHAWAFQGKDLVETTAKRRRYFGVVLDPQAALASWFQHVLCRHLPGRLDLRFSRVAATDCPEAPVDLVPHVVGTRRY